MTSSDEIQHFPRYFSMSLTESGTFLLSFKCNIVIVLERNNQHTFGGFSFSLRPRMQRGEGFFKFRSAQLTERVFLIDIKSIYS